MLCKNRSLGDLRALTSIWRPFGLLDFVLRALRALRTVRRSRLRSGPVKIASFLKIGHFLKNVAFFENWTIFWKMGHLFIVDFSSSFFFFQFF